MVTKKMASSNEKIEYTDFEKVDLRIGKIVSAEAVPKSKNLLKLSVDIGEETPRQILSGIANWYIPEDLLHHYVVVCTNLKPRKIMGIESRGMLLAADVDSVAVLLKPDEVFLEKLSPGTKIL